jgi:4-hydroxy-2-oxoheptanedioate aldolase
MAALPGFSLARRLASGETVYTGWCALPYPIVAETIAREGFNTITIDQQHGLWDTAATSAAIAAVRMVGAAPIVRVPLGAFEAASRALDFGAEGIIAPMINTVADAKAFVSATKYPPLGERSWGPTRAMALAGMGDNKEYLRSANDSIVTLAMIETRTAMDNLDAIAAVPGIDVLFVGPSDLSIGLSNGAELDPHSDAVEAALERIVGACRKAGKVAGLSEAISPSSVPERQRRSTF